MIWEVFLPIQFSKVCVELVMFLPQMLGKIHQWSHLSLCGKASNYKLNFPKKYRVCRLRFFFFFWVSFEKLVSFKKFFHFNVLNLSVYLFIILLLFNICKMYRDTISIPFVSFLPPDYPASLAKGSPILLVFSTN